MSNENVSRVPVCLVSVLGQDGRRNFVDEAMTNATAANLARILNESGESAEFHRLELEVDELLEVVTPHRFALELRGIVA